MTITRQQVDAWDDVVDAAYEQGRQEGMKQERALWELSRVGQEIEAQRPWVGLTDKEQLDLYKKHCMDGWGLVYAAVEAKLKEKNNG